MRVVKTPILDDVITGVIFGAIAVVWLIILVPHSLGQQNQRDRADGRAVDGFARSMQIVRSCQEEGARFLADSGAEVSTPLTRRAAGYQMRAVSRRAVRRRKIGFEALVCLLILGIVFPFVFSVSHLWTAVPVLLLGGWVILSRVSVVTIDRMLEAERKEMEFGDEQMTVVIGMPEERGCNEDDDDLSANERSVDLFGSMNDSLGSLWDPIPVTPITYVSRPLLPRSVRTIDLAGPVSSAEMAVPVTAERSRDAEDDEVAEFPRVVGG